MVDRAQLLPVADRARRDVRRLRLPRLLDRHRHAGEVHAGAPRHHGRPLSARAPFAGTPRRAPWVVAGRARRGRRHRRGPVLHRRGRGRQGRRAHRPVQRHRPPVPHRRARGRRRARSSGPNTRISQEAVVRRVDPRPPLPHRPQRASSRTASSSATSRSSPTTAGFSEQPHESQPRHLQGLRRPRRLSRRRSTRRRRARSARRSSPTSRRSGSRVGRDMRLSSPALAAAFIDGATVAGRRRRRLRDDRDRHALLRRRARRPRRRRRRSRRRTTRSSTTA